MPTKGPEERKILMKKIVSLLLAAMLCMMADGAFLMELASAPGGFDRKLAENIGLRVCHAPGLPGKNAPLSAAMLMKETVYKIIREQEERQ